MNPRLLAPARLARSVLRTQSDERLAELAAGGSEAAFEALGARHRRALVGHCARVVGADAEEAVQDTLMRALAALRRGDEVRRVGPWLHVIAHNVALNLRRTQTARGECALDDVAGGEPAGEDAAPGAGRARLSEVVAAVSALPPRQARASTPQPPSPAAPEHAADTPKHVAAPAAPAPAAQPQPRQPDQPPPAPDVRD